MTESCCDKNKLGCKWCGGIVTFSLAICVMLVGIQVLITGDYEKEQCIITDVHYPKNLPTINNPDTSNFIKCDCGKRCTSDMGTCVKIFLKNNVLNETKLLLKTLLPNVRKLVLSMKKIVEILILKED